MSSVERMRIKVDLPEPFEPRIPTISRRLIVIVTLSTARTSRFAAIFSASFLRQRSKGRGFLNILVTPSMTTASFVSSILTDTAGCISTFIAIDFISSFKVAKERYPQDIVRSKLYIFDWYFDCQNSSGAVQLDTDVDANEHFSHYMLHLKEYIQNTTIFFFLTLK